MRGVRKLATLLGTLVAGLALVLLGAPGASAGGPTSVLLSSPTAAKATGLYGSDEAYRQLEQLLEVSRNITGERAPSMDEFTDGKMVNVTWMIHDTTPWRVDQVHLIPPKGGKADVKVWIHSVVDHDGTPGMDIAEGDWHLSRQPGELKAFLAELGLLDASSAGDAPIPVTPEPGADETAGVDQAAGADASDAAGTRDVPAAAGAAVGTGWWWVFPGIAAGAALALGIRPIARQLPTWPGKLRDARAAARETRAAAREEGRRGELIDR
ncbi:hypothetical protein G6045_26495 [Streptomyces sp. YC504]|uniref:Uncharacterized protein n=1 Tax=Streptomyces mesophilus TaxID=1775132 RepID=A0A6G4XQT8_9ACTN|nr:hypothetical protein [Streptomyces mesophilus]NGO79177.1 hypothetical protein [Streptomyces mesophilus]